MTTNNAILAAALTWQAAGCTPIPVRPDGTKAPAVQWRQLIETAADAGDTVTMFAGADTDGLGIVCGTSSGNLEMLELEGRAVEQHIDDEIATAFADHGMADLWARVHDGYREQSPSGGLHWLYRVDGRPVHGNTKLAMDTDGKVLVETRGQGGYVVVAPSAGRTHRQGAYVTLAGSPDTIPTITADEYDALHAIVSIVDRTPAEIEHNLRTVGRTTASDGLRPGDDYNARTDWADLLIPDGWTLCRQFNSRLRSWTRPGKHRSEGASATTGRNDADNLFVFTTSTALPTEEPISKFRYYALTRHGGDWGAAARQLRADGYGDQRDSGDHLGGLIVLSDRRPTPEVQVEQAQQQMASFWDERPILTHLRLFALARLASPLAVLGVVLTKALMTVPPTIVLPPVVGGDGSLNFMLALVGPSGAGKGAAQAAAADAVHGLDGVNEVTIGSGEGIAHQYGKNSKDGFEWTNPQRQMLFTTPEIDAVAAISSRQGSTLMEQLRKAWSGEPLGFAYASAEKRILIPAHHYRFGFIAGVQPAKSQALLGDADGGTPQRFLWLPVTSREITAEPMVEPKSLSITLPRWGAVQLQTSPKGRGMLPIPDEAADEIRQARVAAARGDADPLDGHALFTREKVAAAFAVLDGRMEVTLDDWRLAGVLMAMSDATRDSCVRTLRDDMLSSSVARTKTRLVSEAVAQEAVDMDRYERARERVLVALEGGESVTRRAIMSAISRPSRAVLDEVLDDMEDAGEITRTVGERGSVVIERGSVAPPCHAATPDQRGTRGTRGSVAGGVA